LKLAQKYDGATVTLSHQGATGTSLEARIGEAVINPVTPAGVVVQGEARTFLLPLQTGFAGAISEGDEIIWESRVYVVKSWQPDRFGAVYTVQGLYQEVRRAGP
jgi:hypothetical protein